MTKDRLAEIIVEAIRRDIASNALWPWVHIDDAVSAEVTQQWKHLVFDALSEAEEDERERP